MPSTETHAINDLRGLLEGEFGMQALRRRGANARVRFAVLFSGMTLVMTTFVGFVMVMPVAAGTSCAVWASAVGDNGVHDWGDAWMDCSHASPDVDWIKGELIETFLPLAFTRASCVNNTNTPFSESCHADYNCNGSGTDEYFMKAMGRDTAGGQSVWIEGTHRDVTC